MYNVTSFTNMQGFFGASNTYTGGWFWSLMLLGVGIVIMVLTMQKTTSDRAIFTAGMGSWLFGTFLFFLGWINWMVYFATIVALVGGLVAVILRGDQEI